MFSGSASWSVAAVGLALLGVAHAQAKPKVAVFGLDPMDLTPAVTKVAVDVTAALRNLASVSQQVSPIEGKDLVEIKMIFDCATITPKCMAAAGKALQADKVIYGTARRNRDTIMVAIVLLDVVGSSRVDLQACKLEYSIVSPK